MRVLHTSDWHLGQRLLAFDREEEHRMALDFLLNLVREQAAEILIVAGDIFDTGNPPHYARSLYYNFLTRLLATGCRHVVIVGGNHDSPAMLNAPGELLRYLNIHVVGAFPGELKDEILRLKDARGQTEAIIAAVPFLRDRDLRYSEAGESSFQRQAKVKEAISAHYHALAGLLAAEKSKDVPVIATGHLYATGATTSEKQNNIYAGNEENIDADQFPDLFDYIALGHIHRAQAVGGQSHIRYSGSIIPLSFSETADVKSVCLLDFDGRSITRAETVEVPQFRRLKTIQGTLDEVREKLLAFDRKGDRELTPWVEVIVETDQVIPQLDVELQEFVAEMNLVLMRIRLHRKQAVKAVDAALSESLEDLDVLEVFRRKCRVFGSPPEEMEELEQTFLELRSWMAERQAD
ncbi:MAG TPA: exonuclease SbcCD subunit D C-terminal domain-containing protein [Flavilitoribacter sp.]|nr:exonuclease SbcCD subunit D C-terminal domain-containing protein [Flavilitoribacter sp.]